MRFTGRKSLIVGCLLLWVPASAVFAAERISPKIDPAKYLEHVKYLASEELRGRGTGTRELETAAQYIAEQFRSVGLLPPDGKSYFQEFTVTTNAKLGSGNRFEYLTDQRKAEIKFPQEFIPFNFSAGGKFSAPVVFVGYGITAKEYDYDDYEGVNVEDRLVVMLRHEPQEFDEKSPFAGKIYTEHSQFFSKAVNAKLHRARGVILVNDVASHGGDSDELEPFAKTVGPSNAGIPFVHVKAEVAGRWLALAGKTLEQIQEGIDKDLRPRSFALPGSLRVKLEVDVKRELRTVHNVAGYLPGETSEYIIVGAHYDHLGLGEQFSMAPSLAGTPHPGADDNASGTAGVIELARWFSLQPKRKRGILFLTFAGEELGLLGSSFYVNNPEIPLDRAVAMINMDMIGRIRDGKVYVGGAGTGTSFRPMLEDLLSRSPLKVDFSDTTGYGSSDHTSFTTKQVPVLFFFSGLHGDYHKPSDTWDKIDAPETARLLDFVAEATTKLAGEAERPQFVRVVPPRGAHGGGPTGSMSSGYGPYFGSIPDFAEVPNGVRFADIQPASPADKAGLRGGDILTEFDGKPIQNLYDFTYALRAKKPGDQVKVKVLRGGGVVEASVLLEKRK